ncbi:hypothetical protein SAMN06264364_12361 [Quadrisphaera granulorum]|uniref:Uncharacterized protein n=1 Tax=Quadrisphaera granulorum TaxID=317664 RepID=A0A315ZX87_9ACTN|nr:hypothetical protein [Quadrisphaera granulorum]PWJ50251.1 hypothetical protein BXY45_12361 [Quadrisphaera granulorum]SZE98017.1 hypothetical protein SAMN06264364_12361 [Quadrisphaera granulorum]
MSYEIPGAGGGSFFDPSEGARRAVLVLPVLDAERAADICAMSGVAAVCAPVSGAGVVAVPAPREGVLPGLAGVDAAERLSRMLRGLDVVLLLAEGEQGQEGQVTAQTWRGGQQVPDGRPAGLLLATWPGDVLRLLLGSLEVSEVSGAATSVGRSRWSAVRGMLRARRGRS